MKQDKRWHPDLMIHRARSLRRVVEEINRDEKQEGPEDGLLLEGKVLVEPVILSLGTEIAFKGLAMLGT